MKRVPFLSLLHTVIVSEDSRRAVPPQALLAGKAVCLSWRPVLCLRSRGCVIMRVILTDLYTRQEAGV